MTTETIIPSGDEIANLRCNHQDGKPCGILKKSLPSPITLENVSYLFKLISAHEARYPTHNIFFEVYADALTQYYASLEVEQTVKLD